MSKTNKTGLKTEPCGTPNLSKTGDDVAVFQSGENKTTQGLQIKYQSDVVGDG